MLLKLLLVLQLYLPVSEQGLHRRFPKPVTIPTRPLTCAPHKVRPMISFKKTPLNTPLAIGTSNFKELVQKNDVFFDSSLFIKTVLDFSEKNPTMLILSPNKWGKTINLDMLKTYLEIPVDDLGNRILPWENSTIHKLFKYGIIDMDDGTIQELKVPMRIWRYEYLFQMYQGKYPVIYVTFKHVFGTNYAQIKGKMQKAISRAFREHKYMLKVLQKGQKDNTIYDAERKIKWFKANLYLNTPFEKTTTGSISFLCQLLRNHFRKRVFVLLDDYDACVYSILRTPELSITDVTRVLHLFANFIGWTFRGNPFLQRGIAVGTSQLGQYPTSSWKKYTLHSIAENPFPMMQYFGLADENFLKILNFYKIDDRLSKQAMDWYGGYTASNISEQYFYNPASVIQFLNSRKITSYWQENSNLDAIGKLLRISRLYREDVFALLSERCVHTGERLVLNERTLSGLRDIFAYSNVTSGIVDDRLAVLEVYPNITFLFHAYLMDQGILTIVRSHGSANLAKIPNKEVALEFTKRMIYHIREQYNIRQDQLRSVALLFLEFIRNSDVPTSKLNHFLKMIFANSASFINHVRNITNGDYCDGPERPEYMIFAGIVLEMQCLSKMNLKAYYNRHLNADIVIKDVENQHATVIQIEYNGTIENISKKAQNYEYVFHNTHTSIIKYIAINVPPFGDIEIRAKTQHVNFTYVEPPTTHSVTYHMFKITPRKNRFNKPLKSGMVFVNQPFPLPVTTENPDYN